MCLAHPDKALTHVGEHYVAPTMRQFLKDMAYNPLLARNSSSADVILQSDAANLLFTALYGVSTWPDVAKVFAEAIYHSDGNGFIQYNKKKDTEQCPLVEEYSLDSTPVLCIDGHS